MLLYIAGLLVQGESLFTKPHTDLDASYLPRFFTNVTDLFNYNVTLVNNALTLCGNVIDNKECFFDLALTANEDIANQGQAFKKEENQVSVSISK